MQQALYAARHTYATVLMNDNAPVSLSAEAMGHADTRANAVLSARSKIDQANELLSDFWKE
jgi:integrase